MLRVFFSGHTKARPQYLYSVLFSRDVGLPLCGIGAATELTRAQIEQLSDQAWVARITLSQNLQIVQE